MGTRGHLAQLLYLHEHARPEPPPQDQARLNSCNTEPQDPELVAGALRVLLRQ